MAQKKNYFLKLDGIAGDSNDPDHAGWIDVVSFRVERSDSNPSGSNGGAGKAEFTNIFWFISQPGTHSPLLQHASNTSWPINSGVLEIVEGTGCTRTVSLRVRFSDLMIARYRATDGLLRDDFGLSFASIRYEFGTPPPAAEADRRECKELIRPAAIRSAQRK
jgi:type VI secretion system secreted protein Hcp